MINGKKWCSYDSPPPPSYNSYIIITLKDNENLAELIKSKFPRKFAHNEH